VTVVPGLAKLVVDIIDLQDFIGQHRSTIMALEVRTVAIVEADKEPQNNDGVGLTNGPCRMITPHSIFLSCAGLREIRRRDQRRQPDRRRRTFACKLERRWSRRFK